MRRLREDGEVVAVQVNRVRGAYVGGVRLRDAGAVDCGQWDESERGWQDKTLGQHVLFHLWEGKVSKVNFVKAGGRSHTQ